MDTALLSPLYYVKFGGTKRISEAMENFLQQAPMGGRVDPPLASLRVSQAVPAAVC